MNANASECSVLTLADTAGLRGSLDAKLCGRNGKFWLVALKRLDRKENPWIPFDKVICNIRGHMTTTVPSCLDKLKALNIGVVDIFADLFIASGLENDDSSLGKTEEYDVVSVRLGDLLNREERQSFTYQDMLDKASREYGFVQCKLHEGLVALTGLLEECSNLKIHGQTTEYMICSSVIHKVEDMDRIPAAFCWHGQKKGLATLRGIKTSPGPYGHNPLSETEIRLLLRSDHF